MAFVSLVSPSLSGNTRSLRHKTNRKRARSWCFTWNNYTPENLSQLSQPNYFNSEISKLIFQEEIGKESTPHLQGMVQFKNQIDFHKLKEQLPKCHLEKCKSVSASIKYCSKEDTRSGTRYTYGISESEITKIKIPRLTDDEVMINLRKMARLESEQLERENKCILCEELLPCSCPDYGC